MGGVAINIHGGFTIMGLLNFRELLDRWRHKQLTVKQLLGQLLQWALKTDETVIALTARTQRTNRRLKAIEEILKIEAEE